MISKALPLCLCVLLTGCGPKPAPLVSPLPAPALPARIRFALAGTPRSLDPVPVTVRVDDNEQPVTGAHVLVVLSMPSMSMPDNKTFLRETRPGTYTGTVRFSMSGTWVAAVGAAKNGAQTGQNFPVAVQ